MSNYENLKILISGFSGQDSIITVPRVYIEVTGDYNTAILLNQIIFWSDKSKRKDGLFYKTYAEWEEEILLSEYQVRRSVGVLKDLGFVDTELKRANGSPTVHYRYNHEVVSVSILEFLKNGRLSNLGMDTKQTKETITDDYTNDYKQLNKTIVQKEEWFNTFWKEYPRKTNKKNAKRTFLRIINEELYQTILADIRVRKNTKDWTKDKGKFVPHPTTYLNGERWNDQIKGSNQPKQEQENYLGIEEI